MSESNSDFIQLVQDIGRLTVSQQVGIYMLLLHEHIEVHKTAEGFFEFNLSMLPEKTLTKVKQTVAKYLEQVPLPPGSINSTTLAPGLMSAVESIPSAQAITTRRKIKLTYSVPIDSEVARQRLLTKLQTPSPQVEHFFNHKQ